MSNDEVTARPEDVVVGQGVLREGVHLGSRHGVGILRHGQAVFSAVDEAQVPHNSLQRCGYWTPLRPEDEPVGSGPRPVNIFLCGPSADPDTDGPPGNAKLRRAEAKTRLFSNHAVTAAIMGAKKAMERCARAP